MFVGLTRVPRVAQHLSHLHMDRSILVHRPLLHHELRHLVISVMKVMTDKHLSSSYCSV